MASPLPTLFLSLLTLVLDGVSVSRMILEERASGI
jgi:hypothetical protein